ncbi:hypothetical protein [Hyphomonas sp.]|uniref:hypothetical protein n=1 Tax=Hyphomonas sp. TaxID=87 RepID=UPI001BCD1B8D|nr:hypothetical protein [Hyphomonas sp.]
MIRRSAFIALAFGVFLVIFEIAGNWGNWRPWPFWLVSFIASGALILGGLRTLNRGSSRLLSAAWGAAAGIFWMSYFTHVETLVEGIDVAKGEGTFTLVTGLLLVVAIAGLFMSLTRRTI